MVRRRKLLTCSNREGCRTIHTYFSKAITSGKPPTGYRALGNDSVAGLESNGEGRDCIPQQKRSGAADTVNREMEERGRFFPRTPATNEFG